MRFLSRALSSKFRQDAALSDPCRQIKTSTLALTLVLVALLDFAIVVYLSERGKTQIFVTKMEIAPPCVPISPSDVGYTLVTQFSANRLWMMGHHCMRWGTSNPVSVAVLTDMSVASVTQELLNAGCSSDQLTVQTLPKSNFELSNYPVNLLRNMALSAVKTTHVMFIDVDFWTSSNLHEVLNMTLVRKEFARDPKLAGVVPAFQMNGWCKESDKDISCRMELTEEMPRDVPKLLTLMMQGDASMFDASNYHGHGSTSFGLWLLQRSGDFFFLPCIKSHRYEPYLAFRYCQELPPFQEQFTGYGKNKMTFIMQLRRSGYDFAQLGGVFLVHYPHRQSEARKAWEKVPNELKKKANRDQGEKRASKLMGTKQWPSKERQSVDWSATTRGQVDHLFLEFERWLESEVPNGARVLMCDMAGDEMILWVNG